MWQIPSAPVWVGGLACPGGRLTGLTNTTPTLAAKWLQLHRAAAPCTDAWRSWRVLRAGHPYLQACDGGAD